MAFLIGGANSAADTGYDVDNSCMFEGDDSGSYMKKDLDSGTSQKIMTISFWVKRSGLTSAVNVITDSSDNVGTTYAQIAFNTSNQLDIQFTVSSGSTARITTNRIFRDIAAWYNVCVALDTTQSTDTNRLKIYINGAQETSFATSNWPDQNIDTQWGNGSGVIWVSSEANAGSNLELDGYLAEFVYLDGTAASPTSFGEFDSDSPQIWKPIDVSGLTFGNNGFYLDFEASDNLGNDANGGTDLTEAGLGATNQANDNPTNNFCVMNTLDKYWPTTGTAAAFSQGNLKVVGGSGSNSSTGYSYYTSTFGLSAGKWYWEVHITDIPAGGGQSLVGIIDVTQRYNQNLGEIVNATGIAWGIKNNGHVFNNNQGAAAETGTFAEGDTVGIALDITNSKMYFSKGGAWSDGNEAWDSTTFNASVGAVDITAVGSTHNGYWFVTVGGTEYSATTTWTLNFGSPVISISSGNADENGYGNFEYAVPDGFLAICTKNLGSAGG